MYYFEVENYKQIDASNLEELEEHANHLYDMYLGPDADMKINVSSIQMKTIDDALKTGVRLNLTLYILPNGRLLSISEHFEDSL